MCRNSTDGRNNIIYLFIYLFEHLLSASSRDEPKTLYSDNYTAILCVCTLVVYDSESVTNFTHHSSNIHRSEYTALFGCYMAGATWNCCRLGAYSVYTIQPCTTLQCHFIRTRIRRMHVCLFSCNLPPALWAEWAGSFTCYCGNTGVERIPKLVSTESWPWRRKFSRRSCRDSNQRPSDYKSGALTTEPSPPPAPPPPPRSPPSQ